MTTIEQTRTDAAATGATTREVTPSVSALRLLRPDGVKL